MKFNSLYNHRQSTEDTKKEMQSSTNNTAIVRPSQSIVRYTNINSINGNKISNEHQNRQEIHSAHSSISITRLNRDKFQSAKSDSIGDHRKNKNYTIFKDNNIIYVTKNPSESSHQKRRKSNDIQNHITVEHINRRQSLSSGNEIKKNSIEKNIIQSSSNNIHQSEYSDKNNTDKQNRKKSLSSNIKRNIQFKSVKHF
jgi:hypothetical protein